MGRFNFSCCRSSTGSDSGSETGQVAGRSGHGIRHNRRCLLYTSMDNIQKFLLELGNGFAFVGREYRIEIGSTENFIDMLFYHIHLHCYVVVEMCIRDRGMRVSEIAAAEGVDPSRVRESIRRGLRQLAKYF